MEGIFFVKSVGTLQNLTNQKGEQLPKLNIVLSTKEVRSGDNGLYAVDQDFSIDLLGERATQFNLPVGQWVVASISAIAREYNGTYHPEIRLNRYVKL